MTERMHPYDLRAIVAASMASCDRDVPTGVAIRWADELLADLERTAPKADPFDPNVCSGCPVTGQMMEWKARAEAAEAKVKDLEKCPECGGEGFHWGDCHRFRDNPVLQDMRSKLDEAEAHAKEGIEIIRRLEGMLAEAKAEVERLGAEVMRRDARLETANADNRSVLAELNNAKARLTAIDAAKDGEPPMPTPPNLLPYGAEYIAMLKNWGRQGWDAAAAWKAERDNLLDREETLHKARAEAEDAAAALRVELERLKGFK